MGSGASPPEGKDAGVQAQQANTRACREMACIIVHACCARTGVGHVADVQQVRRTRARVGIGLPMPRTQVSA
jgi:hypothetical protein